MSEWANFCCPTVRRTAGGLPQADLALGCEPDGPCG